MALSMIAHKGAIQISGTSAVNPFIPGQVVSLFSYCDDCSEAGLALVLVPYVVEILGAQEVFWGVAVCGPTVPEEINVKAQQ